MPCAGREHRGRQKNALRPSMMAQGKKAIFIIACSYNGYSDCWRPVQALRYDHRK